jgi:hypothetical protein
MNKIRPEIMAFAEAMEAKMAEHDRDRGDGWKTENIQFFIIRGEQEMEELKEAHFEGVLDWCGKESLDVANFMMMLFWKSKNPGKATDMRKMSESERFIKNIEQKIPDIIPDIIPECECYPCEELLYGRDECCDICNKNGNWHIKGENEYPIERR